MLVGTKCDLKEDKKSLEEMRKLKGPEAQPISTKFERLEKKNTELLEKIYISKTTIFTLK